MKYTLTSYQPSIIPVSSYTGIRLSRKSSGVITNTVVNLDQPSTLQLRGHLRLIPHEEVNLDAIRVELLYISPSKSNPFGGLCVNLKYQGSYIGFSFSYYAQFKGGFYSYIETVLSFLPSCSNLTLKFDSGIQLKCPCPLTKLNVKLHGHFRRFGTVHLSVI